MMPLPPSLSGNPPMGSSPVSVPTGSPGAQAGAMAKVRQAIDILNSSISAFPPGTPVHKELISAVEALTKHMPPTDAALGVNQTALRDLQQNAGKNAMLQQVMSSLGAGGAQQQGAPGPSGAPPPPGGM